MRNKKLSKIKKDILMNVDQSEIENFDKYAHEWWNKEGHTSSFIILRH